MVKKITFTRKEIEVLFEEVINDIKANCKDVHGAFYVGKKKLGIIRYFLSLRLDYITKLKQKDKKW